MGDISNQKQIFFFVPNYDKTNSSDSNASPLSYVMLGSAKSHEYLTTARLRGDDLLESAGLSTSVYGNFFADDNRGAACGSCALVSTPFALAIHQTEAHDTSDCHDADAAPLATTYYRSDASGSFTTDEACASLSAELLGNADGSVDARGGYRDHTDGNRIVTVRGDRVEVVVGNFKRVVFGRVSGDAVGATTYEAAGGHVLERSSADALQVYAIEHVKETSIDGVERWKVVERAENGDRVVRYSGALTEHHNGPTRTERVGVDSSSTTKNPEITRSHRFGKAFETIDATGDVTWSTEVDKLVDITDGANATRNEEVSCVSLVKSRGKLTQRAFTFKEELRANIAAETDFYLAKARVSAGGAQFDEVDGHYKVSTGVRIDAHAGPVIRMNYGGRTRMSGLAPWIRGCIAGSFSLDVGIYTELSLLWIYTAPIYSQTRIGNLVVNHTKAENNIGENKALALLMEL